MSRLQLSYRFPPAVVRTAGFAMQQPVETPSLSERLDDLEESLDKFSSILYSKDESYLDDRYVPALLENLDAFDPHEGAIPMRVGQTLLQLYRKMDTDRFSQDMVTSTRQTCQKMARQWIEAGQLDIGSLNLDEALQKGTFSGKAGKLRLYLPTKENSELISDIAFYDDRAKALLNSWTHDQSMPQKVDELMELTHHGMFYSRDRSVVRRLLQEAPNNSAVRRALLPHLDTLMQGAEQAEAEGLLVWQTKDRLELYGDLGKAFPELLTQDRFWSQLARFVPLSHGSGDDLVETLAPLLEKEPSRAGALAESILKTPKDQLSEAHGKLFETAIADFGHRPSRELLTLGVTRLIQPTLKVWERFEEKPVKEMSAYLRGLTALKKLDPTALGAYTFHLRGDALSAEEYLFTQFLRFDHSRFDDNIFTRVARGDDSFYPAFVDFVDLNERQDELLTNVQKALKKNIDLDEAEPKALLSLALLTHQVADNPELEKELMDSLSLARSEEYPTIRSLKEQLYRRREVDQRLPSLEQMPLDDLGVATELLIQAGGHDPKEIPLPDKRDDILAAWARRLEREPGLKSLPTGFTQPLEAFEHYRFLEDQRGPLSREQAWDSLRTHIGNTRGELAKARGVFEIEVAVRQRFGQRNFEKHWSAFAAHLARHDWEPGAGWQFLEVYDMQDIANPGNTDIDIEEGGIQIGDVFLEIDP